MSAAYDSERLVLEDEFLSVERVAALLDVSPLTIRRTIHRGELPAVRVGERQLRVPASRLREYLEQRREPA